MRRFVGFVITILALVVLSGCYNENGDEGNLGVAGGDDAVEWGAAVPDTGGTVVESDVVDDAADPVVARVNGVDLRGSNIAIHLNPIRESMSWEHFMLFGEWEIDPENEHPDGGTFRRAILEEAVRIAAFYVVIEQYAATFGIVVSEAEHEIIADQIGQMEEAWGVEEMRRMLTEDGFRDLEHLKELYESMFLMEGVVRQFLMDDELFARFEHLMPPEPEVPELLGAKHILFMFDNFETEEEAEAEAIAMWGRAITGEDFDLLMMTYGQDPGMWTFVDGYSFAAGDMQPEFEQATRELELGGISPPVRTVFGFHIIKRVETNVDDWHMLHQTQPMSLEDRRVDAIFKGLEDLARNADTVFLPALDGIDLD